MKARDVMTEGPASVRSTTPVSEAIAVLQSLGVRHLPVIDRHGELVGILSDRDLRKYQLSGDAAELPVSRVMSNTFFVVSPETDLEELTHLMLDQQISAVPIVDADGTRVGIVSDVQPSCQRSVFAKSA